MNASPPGVPKAQPGPLQPWLATVRARIRDNAQRNRAVLWPLAPLLLLCVLSAPLLGAWMRWVELPGLLREEGMLPCAAASATDRGAGTAPRTADAASAALDPQLAALAPARCTGMRRIDTAGLRTAAYRFEDGSLFTLHLRIPLAAPARADATDGPGAEGAAAAASEASAIASDGADKGTPDPRSAGAAEGAAGQIREPTGREPTGTPTVDTSTAGASATAVAGTDADRAPLAPPAGIAPAASRPAPPPILTASCPIQSRQSLLVLAGLLLVGAIVILHRLRAGGKFLDFRTVVREPLLPGEILLLLYAFTVILGTGIGLQFGNCAATDHREAVQVERGPMSLKDLAVPAVR